MNEKSVSLDDFIVEANIVERISAKTQRPYKFIQLKFTNGYEMMLFPSERSELALIEMMLEAK